MRDGRGRATLQNFGLKSTEVAGNEPGMEHVVVERNFIGGGVGKNFAGDVRGQEGK